MAKYFTMIMILFCSVLFAQDNYKGRISLILNEEKIELPIKSVVLRKSDYIIISVRAVINNEKVNQHINLEWETKNLSIDDNSLSLYNNFKLAVSNKSKVEKDELRFRMNNNGKDGELYVRKGNRTWELTSFEMKFNIESVSFENSHINIKGSLSLKARDKHSETPMESISEIKDCKFEIVI